MAVDISAVICSRNRKQTLARTLESLRKLEVPDGLAHEILLVDNGSTDGTRELMDDFVKLDPEVWKYLPLRAGKRAFEGEKLRGQACARRDYRVYRRRCHRRSELAQRPVEHVRKQAGCYCGPGQNIASKRDRALATMGRPGGAFVLYML